PMGQLSLVLLADCLPLAVGIDPDISDAPANEAVVHTTLSADIWPGRRRGIARRGRRIRRSRGRGRLSTQICSRQANANTLDAGGLLRSTRSKLPPSSAVATVRLACRSAAAVCACAVPPRMPTE